MRFVQGIDYGPRKGTLGLALHMSEGGDGLVTYLARKSGETVAQWKTRVRGVSCNVAILSTGERVQMVDWAHASGSMNPADRSTDKAFYGRRFLLDVLGEHYVDPNAYSISAEIAGFRATGPTPAQVESMLEWAGEMRAMFPTLRGAFGHADQTDTKGCPGTAPTMLDAWARVGHGLFTKEEAVQAFSVFEQPAYVEVKQGARLYLSSDLAGTPVVIDPAREMPYVGTFSTDVRIVAYEPPTPDTNVSSKAMFVRATDLGAIRLVSPTDLVHAALEKARTAALAAVGSAIDKVAQEV